MPITIDHIGVLVTTVNVDRKRALPPAGKDVFIFEGKYQVVAVETPDEQSRAYVLEHAQQIYEGFRANEVEYKVRFEAFSLCKDLEVDKQLADQGYGPNEYEKTILTSTPTNAQHLVSAAYWRAPIVDMGNLLVFPKEA